MDDLRELLNLLKQRGLNGHVTDANPARIIGGRFVSEASGIRVYQDAFSVSRNAEGWLVRTSGKGQSVDEVVVATADDVVRAIVDCAKPCS